MQISSFSILLQQFNKQYSKHRNNQNMLIEHREYIALVDEIEYLKKDNNMLKKENSIIMQQLVKAKQKIQTLTNHHHNNMHLIQTLHTKCTTHHSNITNQVIQQIAKTTNQTKDFIDMKFKQLQHNTLNDNKQIEIKTSKSKMDIYELTDFVNQIKTLRKQTTHPEYCANHKLTLAQLYKWIKSLVLFNLSQQKHSPTRSIDDYNIKKQKLNQTKSTLNFTHSKNNLY